MGRMNNRHEPAIIIGDLRIDFDIRVGDLDRSAFRSEQIDVTWSSKPFEPSEPVAGMIPAEWKRIRAVASEKGQYLADGGLARLVHYSESFDKILLTLQPTSYRIFCATNLNLDSPVVARPEGGGCISIRQLAGSELFSLPSPYLANPLNVIAMVVTSDNFTFSPVRSAAVYENPNTRQASVGGALAVGEHPAEALLREIKEEWGLDVDRSEVTFLALGINRRTGEPDLIALVHTKADSGRVSQAFKSHAEKQEFADFSPLSLDRHDLESLVSALSSTKWCQPSDQAAFLLALIRTIGMEDVEKAIRALPLRTRS